MLKNRVPVFSVLSRQQIEDLHAATLHILEKTGVAFNCQEALEILGAAGADVSDPGRVKIPAHLVEQTLKTAPGKITLYTREGEPAMVLDGTSGPYFGAHTDMDDILDPYTRRRRRFYVEDIADMARLIDALPNIAWARTSAGHTPLPGAISDKVSVLQCLLNCSKPIVCVINDASSLRDMLALCATVAGGEEKFRQKPFLVASNEPISPLLQAKEAMEKSLLCAEKGIPNVVYNMPMAGATVPATFAGCLSIANAELLSHLVVLQLKNPGAPVIFGSMPNIIDMKTTICPYGSPELSVMIAAMTEITHHYGLPMFGTAGCTDAEVIGAQAAAEITYSILVSTMSGADLVHDVGLMHHCTLLSPELVVLADEIIDMAKVMQGGIEISEETLALDLIERLGPRSHYIAEEHTFKHFRKFWSPALFDRSMAPGGTACETSLNKKTLEILETHRPKALPEDLVTELKSMEAGWFQRLGLEPVYPKKPAA